MNDSSRRPELRKQISHEIIQRNEDGEEFTDTFVNELDEFPEVIEQWEDYLKNKWLIWAEQDRKLREIDSIYSDLYFLYQRQQRLGEAYEIVLGTGLLLWETPNRQKVKRHLITAQASLIFDANRRKITVEPGLEGTNLRLEQDMLEPSERPELKEQSLIEESLSEIEDVLAGEEIHNLLEAWINSIPNSLGYDKTLEVFQEVSSKPLVSFSPALILRKRGEKDLSRTFDAIATKIQSGESGIPFAISDLVKDPSEEAPDENYDSDEDREKFFRNTNLYFPLVSNEEQRQIAYSLARDRGVVVQGPPGTGKSHTIVNLVCHLLAHGKRVLVTSHTTRALKVLISKFPEEISALIVMALGADKSSQEQLEKSVNGILQSEQNISKPQLKKKIENLEKELDLLRRKESALSSELIQIREVETFQHKDLFGLYSGTLQEIAKEINKVEVMYSWLIDDIDSEWELPFSNEEMKAKLTLLRQVKDLSLNYKNLDIPELSKLITPEEFNALCEKQSRLEKRSEELNWVVSRSEYSSLASLDEDKITSLCNSITVLQREIDSLKTRYSDYPWVNDVIERVLKGTEKPFIEISNFTENALLTLDEALKNNSAILSNVTGLENLNYQDQLVKAKALKEHFTNGGGLGFLLFKNPAVKEAKEIIDQVRVDGQKCVNAETVEKFIHWLEVKINLQQLHEIWSSLHDGVEQVSSIVSQKGEYESLRDILNRCLNVSSFVENCRTNFDLIEALPEPQWFEPKYFQVWKDVFEKCKTDQMLFDMKKAVDNLIEEIQEVIQWELKPNPVYNQLLTSITEKDHLNYKKAYEKLLELQEIRKIFDQQKEFQSFADDTFPKTFSEVMRSLEDPVWDERMESFENAWNWKRADSWVNKMNDPALARQKERELVNIRHRIRSTISQIAAGKSWLHCLSRLSDAEKQNLKAWQSCVEKIGKGTGKRAPKYLAEARKYMAKCRTAIPAWIMPLYRIAETVEADSSMFDVVIIDEASQSGPEAILLQYLADSIVVVGDNKQISPTSMVNRDDVDLLRERHIKDLPHPAFYGVDYSFFDQAAIRYPCNIRLREHFRCMPEIIQFSNDLCYSGNPLIPLKQYDGSRVQPTVAAIYVQEGYQKGKASNAINPPEADAIAKFIEEKCQDPQYDKKTMGVISLLGDAQAEEVRKRLMKTIGPAEMEKHNIECGNPYAFQGDERDIIVMSMVSAPGEDHRIGTLASDTHVKRFNVASSRAKEQMILFHSATLNDLSKRCLRYRFLDYCQNPQIEQTELPSGLSIQDIDHVARNANREIETPPVPFDSWFEADVFLQIHRRGYRVIPQYEVGKYKIDMLIEGMRGRLAVECDGDRWHGRDQYESDMARQRQLERSGYKFWRVRGSEYYRNVESSLNPLWNRLDELEIYPKDMDNRDEVNLVPNVIDVSKVEPSSFHRYLTPIDMHDDKNLSFESDDQQEKKTQVITADTLNRIDEPDEIPTRVSQAREVMSSRFDNLQEAGTFKQNTPSDSVQMNIKEEKEKKEGEENSFQDEGDNLQVGKLAEGEVVTHQQKAPKKPSEDSKSSGTVSISNDKTKRKKTSKRGSQKKKTIKSKPIQSNLNVDIQRSIVKTINGAVWKELAHWTKMKNALNPRTRQFIYSMSIYASSGKDISDKQVKYAYSVLEQVKELGFKPESYHGQINFFE